MNLLATTVVERFFRTHHYWSRHHCSLTGSRIENRTSMTRIRECGHHMRGKLLLLLLQSDGLVPVLCI